MINDQSGWKSTFDSLLQSGFPVNSVGKLVMLYQQPVQSAVLYAPQVGAVHPIHINEERKGLRADVVAAMQPFMLRSRAKKNSAGWDTYDVTDWVGLESALRAIVNPATGEPQLGGDWTADEVKGVVQAYFEMLQLERKGQSYNKAARNRVLRQQLSTRSAGAVERKHQNISSVLLGMDLPYIKGYKPLPNIQDALRAEVERFVAANISLVESLNETTDSQQLDAPLQRCVVPIPPVLDLDRKGASPRRRIPRLIDFAAVDARNRDLGRAGEDWTVRFERDRLAKAGIPDPESKVVWVSRELGDGAGFDIQSIEADGSPRYIEVKTTNGSATTPFFVTLNELAAAAEFGSAFFFYRVHEFSTSPKLFIIRGDLSQAVTLDPILWQASFRRFVGS